MSPYAGEPRAADAPGLVPLVDARAKAEALLSAAFDALPELGATVAGPLDALDPPAVRVGWAEPWLEPYGQAGLFFARLEVFCIGDRIDPTPGFETVEGLVRVVCRTFSKDSYPWPVVFVGAPRAYEVGGKSYLAAQVVSRLPVGVD